jgi:hypothetical protein
MCRCRSRNGTCIDVHFSEHPASRPDPRLEALLLGKPWATSNSWGTLLSMPLCGGQSTRSIQMLQCQISPNWLGSSLPGSSCTVSECCSNSTSLLLHRYMCALHHQGCECLEGMSIYREYGTLCFLHLIHHKPFVSRNRIFLTMLAQHIKCNTGPVTCCDAGAAYGMSGIMHVFHSQSQ